jgi:polysaccharide chain length determinant protein (PEP-CTERM system associated)
MDSPIVQIQNYLHILYCRRYIFVLIAATTALILVVGCFFMQKNYEAKSTVFIEKNVVNALMKGITITPSMNDRIRVLRYHMLSRDIVLRVLQKLDMDVQVNNPDQFESLIKSCQAKTRINIKGNDLFFISFIDPDPQFAKDYINTLVNTYVEENIADKREESYGAGRFLSEQVTFYKQKLDKLDEAINNHRKKTGIFTTVTEQSIIAEIKDYEEELKELLFDKNELLSTVKTIGEQLKFMKNIPAVNDDPFTDMSGNSGDQWRMETIRNKLRELLLVYNDKYPTVVKLKAQLADLEAREQEPSDEINMPVVIADEISNPIQNPIFVDLKMRMNVAQAELNAVIAREHDLQGQIASNRQLLETFPDDKKILADMAQESATNREIYQKLLARVGVAEVSKQMEIADKTTTFRIIDPAILPYAPVGRKRIVKLLLSVIVGFGAGIGAVVAREMLDDTVKDADTVRALGVTVLAEIPFMFNDVDSKMVRKRDRWVYSYAAVCLLGVGALFAHDMLGMTVIDRLVASDDFHAVFSNAVKFLH